MEEKEPEDLDHEKERVLPEAEDIVVVPHLPVVEDPHLPLPLVPHMRPGLPLLMAITLKYLKYFNIITHTKPHTYSLTHSLNSNFL